MSPIRLLSRAFDAVIFDMDGLVFDTERLCRDAVQTAAKSVGFEITDEFYAATIGVPGPECDELIREKFGYSFPFEDYLARYHNEWSRLEEHGVPLKPGVVSLLDHLRAHRTPIGLATSSSREATERHLTRSNLLSYFDVVATRSDVARGKPAPDLFIKAANELGVRAERCLVLEDSHNGVRAAVAAGCCPIMVPDLLAATSEMEDACLAILADLDKVRMLLALPAEDAEA